MELRSLDRTELRAVYKKHLTNDFPRAERKPLFVIERLMREERYDAHGVYEGAELLAYAFLLHDSQRDYVLLDYLAVCEGGRGKGVGTAVLELLEGHYAHYRGVLAEAEAPDEKATPEENALRIRRQEFYIRAGFRKLGHQAKLFTVVYDMLASGEADSESAIEAHRRLYCRDGYCAGKLIEIPYEKS